MNYRKKLGLKTKVFIKTYVSFLLYGKIFEATIIFVFDLMQINYFSEK